MTEKIDLQEIEKRVWVTFSSKDGFYDIFIGVMLLVSAFQAFFYNIWFTSFILISVLIVPLGKKYITIPRIGLVKFGPERLKNQLKMFIAIGIALGATFILFLLPMFIEKPPAIFGSLWIAGLIASIFGVWGYYMSNIRLIIYGLMFAAGEIIWGVFGEPLGPLTMLFSGSIMVITGIFITIRFMRAYPLPPSEVANGL